MAAGEVAVVEGVFGEGGGGLAGACFFFFAEVLLRVLPFAMVDCCNNVRKDDKKGSCDTMCGNCSGGVLVFALTGLDGSIQTHPKRPRSGTSSRPAYVAQFQSWQTTLWRIVTDR